MFLRRRRFSRYLFLGMSVLFLASAQFSMILENMGLKLGQNILAAKGILEGYPPWKIYQSRVLGPSIALSLQKILGISFDKAYLLTMFFLLVSFFGILMFIVLSMKNSFWESLSISFSVAFLNVLLMRGDWLYLWDFIDLTVFSLLIWAVLTGRSKKVIVVLILVEALNRNVALILAGWWMLDALLVFRRESGKWPRLIWKVERSQLFSSLVLIVGVFTVIQLLQTWLFIK